MNRALVELATLREGRSALGRVVAERPELTSSHARGRLTSRMRFLNNQPCGSCIQKGGNLVHCDCHLYRDEAMPTTTTERTAISLRLPPELMTAVSAVEAAIPALSRHAICLAALGIGLAALAEDPALAMVQNVRGKAPATKRKRTK